MLAQPSSPPACPKLLVSVRNASEARAALLGGCDILDIKEPGQGPLGMAAPAEIERIVGEARRLRPRIPVSAALGELIDWQPRHPPELCRRLSFVKLGLAGVGVSDTWISRWQALQHACGEADSEATDGARLGWKWIVVAYADWRNAECPRPGAVLQTARALARDCGTCAGMVLDTCDKTSGPLTEHLSPGEICDLVAASRESGFLFALAGKVTLRDLPTLRDADPEIIGVRSAVCRNGLRQNAVDEAAVVEFRRQVHATWNVSRDVVS